MTFHRVLMYTIFLCVSYTGWASLSSVLQLLGCLFLVSGVGFFFQDLLQAYFSLFSEDISEYRIGGWEAGVQSVKFYNIWEGVLLSENLGWEWEHGREQRFQRSGFCFAERWREGI